MAEAAQRSATTTRDARISRVLHAFITGLRPLGSARDFQQFVQAICAQPDHAGCMEKLGCSTSSLEALHRGVRFDTSAAFINGTLQDFLLYLAVPEVKRLCNGEFLKRVLKQIVNPPSVWEAFNTARNNGELLPPTEVSFAWLLLEVLNWTSDIPGDVESIARNITVEKTFLTSQDRQLRAIGCRIEHILFAKGTGCTPSLSGPGGRHDNDFIDFRRVAIFPTEDELASKEVPYFAPAHTLSETPIPDRLAHHLSNQFRLLREDFLADLREDLVTTSSGKASRGQRIRLSKLELHAIYTGAEKSRVPSSLAIHVEKGLGALRNASDPRSFLKDNPGFVKHQSFGYFINQGTVIAFGTIVRDVDLLCRNPPVVAIRTPGTGALKTVLLALATSQTLEFVVIDTAVFAYEPILRCLQDKLELPLCQHLLCPEDSHDDLELSDTSGLLSDVAQEIERRPGHDLQHILGLKKPVKLDRSQAASLLAGMRQSVSLIQGPPGTGKSFIGALLVKALHDRTTQAILVVCYTNHALDQFLEDLQDIGVPDASIVRLGSKSTARTQHLLLREQAPARRRTRENWNAINRLTEETAASAVTIDQIVEEFRKTQASDAQLLEYLEFSEEDYEYFEAFEVPEPEDDYAIVGETGRAIDKMYLLQRWRQGKDAGVLQNKMSPWHFEIWTMENPARLSKLRQWEQSILSEAADGVVARAHVYDTSQHTLRQALDQRSTELIQTKRIVACTTTGAAMYTKQLQSAAPGILLVEEAGEILESHVLTAMSPNTKQLILIGDHQQLRPKVNNYALTVEKGDGYDLNCSLFERLVLAGFPHATLQQQHRMCPEISNLVRQLTYPDLLDAPATSQREMLRGLRNRVVFIKHTKLELLSQVADRRDQGASVSKQNDYEVKMVKKIVKYMAQQGYGTPAQVVLTPYLGQLSLLRRELAQDNDPVLSDMDSFDLIRAGLLSPASASQKKRPLKLSTIDNYQGEESDIVIVSLTRSNPDGDIGFMVSPERLNVLLSRARKALIIIGNPTTFIASKKGGGLWSSFFTLLAETNSILDGLPVRCAQHPDREMMLCTPEDFDLKCPDGGCSAPCGTMLRCGKHECVQRCHRTADHSKMPCSQRMWEKCPQGHKLSWKCSEGHPVSCLSCDAEDAARLAQQERNARLDQEQQARQVAYARELAGIQAERDRMRRVAADKRMEEEQQAELVQRRKDLKNAKALAAQREAAERAAKERSRSQPDADSAPLMVPLANCEVGQAFSSEAQDDWARQKTTEGAKNEAIDEVMDMIGLEAVKEQFLEIKSKIDLLVRQDLPVAKERLGAALLGNPGTGKTTVARIYAKFLCSVGALPGDVFVETTGAKISGEGVQGCKKLLNDLLNQGGGAFFIDEAYQLTSGSNFGGAAVLDYILPEVENLTGKVVFILAGYNKQMEKFFQHNSGLPSRFPRRMQFADYKDDELLAIMNYNVNKRYEGRMKLQDGPGGLFARIVARRLGRGRGKEGFGNAREVENAVSGIASRQAKRLRMERRAKRGKGKESDDMLFTDTDLIGPQPTDALADNKSWSELQKLTGLQSVKESVEALLSSIQLNYKRELAEEPLVEYSLNKVFVGNPGTGKTTVAKLYGQVLADMGMLTSGEVVIKKPADFVGAVVGASEANTKGILDAAIGKVLVIDEAYGLYGGKESSSDPYRTAVIDTIVAEIQSLPGDDRCVLLLGYKGQMEEMMQHVNPGLARRFPIDSGFVFEDFSDDDMGAILEMKLKNQGFRVGERAKAVAHGMLQRARNRPHFGNAGEVDILLNDAKLRQQKRIGNNIATASGILEALDFDPDFDRGDRANTNVAMLFKDCVGCESIIQQLQGYQTVVANMRQLDMDPREQIPFTFLFRGPPGTGKTATARKMGKVYYDMGFLSKAEVVSSSASDLVGEYVGQTGPKTRKLLESALGKVLFIDEAYRLSGGNFAQEALDELVDSLTSERFFRKLIVIFAGYDADINRLVSANPGLTSRFPETIVFEPLTPQACLDLLFKELGKKKGLDLSQITSMPLAITEEVLQHFETLASLQNFANARDIQTLSKTIFGSILKQADPKRVSMVVPQDLLLIELNNMIAERARRELHATTADATRTESITSSTLVRTQKPKPQHETAMRAIFAKKQIHALNVDSSGDVEQETSAGSDACADDPVGAPSAMTPVHRDNGVGDAVWEKLQVDRMNAEQEECDFRRLQEEERKLRAWLKGCADAKRQRDLEKLERKRKEAEERRCKEALTLAKLHQMGCCPAGYQWIKQQGGYRCAGGSHWVDDGRLNALLK